MSTTTATTVAQDEQPISRTYQYRKVMKPMLERKRRARINRCLDELKELLVGALQAEGESVSRLEKADVLELTVRHLHKLRRLQQMNENSAGERFKAGFISCTNEVSKYMTTISSSGTSTAIDLTVSARLLSHLDHCILQIEQSSSAAAAIANNNNNNLGGHGHHHGPATPGSPILLTNALISPHHHHGIHLAHSFTSSTSSSSSPTSGSGGSLIHSSTAVNIVNSSHLNVLTNYTPPTSPVSSPTNKLSIYHPSSYHYDVQQQKSPSPAHIQTPFQTGYPLSLCVKPKMEAMLVDEPFDLSNNDNVWRPW